MFLCEGQREMQSPVGGRPRKNEKPAAFQPDPHAAWTRHGQGVDQVGQQAGRQQMQVRGDHLLTCLQMQLHQASSGRVQASQSSS